jgi:hypothetical protein
LDEELKNKVVVDVERKSDRIITITLVLEEKVINVISMNAPKVGCEEKENQEIKIQ